MKYKTLLVASMLFTTSAFATGSQPCTTCTTAQTTGSNASQSNNVSTNSEAAASNAGNSQQITFTSPGETKQTVTGTTSVEYSGTQTIKNVPSIGAPALTSSNDTCMGSTSGGVAVAGFGFSLGSTWSDKNCLMLKNSREMWNMGFKAASMARMCMDDLNKEALELTGFKCPTKEAK